MNRLVIIACLGIAFLASIIFLPKLFEDRYSMADEAKDEPTLASDPSWENSPQNNYSNARDTVNNNETMSEIESLKAIIESLARDTINNNEMISEIEPLKATVATLQNEIRKNRESQISQINVDTERAVDSSMDNKMSMDENELRLLQMEEQYRFFYQVDSNFYSEPMDYSWSGSMTDRIESALNSEAASGLNVNYNIECRSSMCRLEIATVDNSVDLEAFKLDFRDQISDVLTAGVVKQDETGKMIVYLGRDNEAFGVIEPAY